jgi:hypothetical protein
MEPTINQILRQAINTHQEGRLEEAEKLYLKILKIQPTHPDANNNMGVLLQGLGRFDEAEESFNKAIEIKPDYADAYNNRGVTLNKLNKLEEAEKNYRKAIELDSNNMEPRDALITLSKQKKLLNLIKKRKVHVKNNIKSLKSVSAKLFDPNLRLSPNPFIFNRAVETELLTNHYKINFKELNKTKDGRYGNGKCSNFQFFENDLTIIKTVAEDLTNIMSLAVKSDIFIFDSFLNIYRAGSGTTPHTHLNQFDKVNKLTNQKYSLTYYLSVGDQNCSEPGNLQLYDPSEEIKLSEGTLVIIPATRKHAAVYNGSKDRVMIGVNFYSLI